MNKSNPQFEEVMVDGQTIVIPTEEAWHEIARTPVFLGTPVYGDLSKGRVLRLMAFVLEHKRDFRLGIFRLKAFKNWLELPLMLLEGRLQRVQIERVMCSQCKWKLKIANPTEPSLYFVAPDELNAVQVAFKLPRVDCPNCCAPLPRFAIWAEPYTRSY